MGHKENPPIMLTDISNLPDHSRLWIFAADRKLAASEVASLMSVIHEYLNGWKAHGAPVSAAAEIRYDQFLLIAANPDVTAPSGCSIDDLTRSLQKIGAQFNVNLMNSGQVYFQANGEIEWTTRSKFKELAQEGVVSLETPVFDNSLTTLGEYRTGKWNVPASDAWQKALIGQ
jgi:hypothetical protein